MSNQAIPTDEELMQRNKIFFQKLIEAGFSNRTEMFAVLNQKANKNGIVFAGDSITDQFPIHEFLAGVPNIYNRGVGGITSEYLLNNIEEHILQLLPTKLFLLIGTNDLGFEKPIDETADRIITICKKVEETCPNVKVHLLSVYPVNESNKFKDSISVRTNENIKKINNIIKKESKNLNNTVYLDLHPVLSDSNGNLKEEYTPDGLHLTAKGYVEVTAFLLNYIND